jgi:hypothetical protein
MYPEVGNSALVIGEKSLGKARHLARGWFPAGIH